VIGVAVFAATLLWLRGDFRVLERYKYVFGVTALFLLFLPLAPGIGETVNGSRLWIHFAGLQFQPGELGKIALIVFLAAYLREKREVLAQGRLKDWGPLLAIWGGAMLVLVATDDLGSALLYYGIFLALLYVATARVAFVAAALALFVAGSVLVTYLVSHVHERVTDWLSPWSAHPIFCPLTGHMAYRQDCQSYQLVQSLYSIAHGGFGGTGLGRGIVTTAAGGPVVPDLNTDFIYSALAQELGLIGAAALLLLYMGFVLRGFRIALSASDGFSKLLAAGLSFGFAFQTFVIVGGITRVIPLTGITLPFVSYGGSSILSNFLLVAGLLLVSHRANREKAA
jgi:cell division protein FtsW (lipid II flippase)